jgi:branched-subunit amino acid transport protein
MRAEWIWLVIGMTAVTYIPRALPLIALHRREIPEPLLRFLGFVPVAILAALLAPSVLLSDGRMDVSPHNLFLLAALPTLVVGYFRRKSMFLTVLVGMGSLVLLRTLLG